MYFFIDQQSISMNFKVFLLIFELPIFLSKYPPIFSNIFDISVKSKYRYIRNYRYFVPCIYKRRDYDKQMSYQEDTITHHIKMTTIIRRIKTMTKSRKKLIKT